MQSIIVYRNPLEAVFWETIQHSGGVIIPILLGIVVFFASLLLFNNIFTKFMGYWKFQKSVYPNVVIFGSVCIGCFATWYLWV